MATRGQNQSKATGSKLLERLAEGGKVPGSRGGKKLQAFLEHGEEIREALQAGYSVKDVWSTLKEDGDVDLSYPLFSQYVRTKLDLRPRTGFEEVSVSPKDEEPKKPELTEEQKRHNMLIHGNPEGIPQP